MCHHVEQIFLSDIFFGCEIWTGPSYFTTQETKKIPTLVAKKVKSDQSW